MRRWKNTSNKCKETLSKLLTNIRHYFCSASDKAKSQNVKPIPRLPITNIVPFNKSLEDLHREYSKLKELIERIKKDVYIANKKSPLQRYLCIREMCDAIDATNSLATYNVSQLLGMGKPLSRFFLSTMTYADVEHGKVYKARDIFYRGHQEAYDIQDTIYEHLIHNVLFPNTAFTLLGKTKIENTTALVFSQPYISCENDATEEEIEKYMGLMGFQAEDYQWQSRIFTNDWLSISINKSNVKSDLNGTLYFLSTSIRFQMSPFEVFRHYLYK